MPDHGSDATDKNRLIPGSCFLWEMQSHLAAIEERKKKNCKDVKDGEGLVGNARYTATREIFELLK